MNLRYILLLIFLALLVFSIYTLFPLTQTESSSITPTNEVSEGIEIGDVFFEKVECTEPAALEQICFATEDYIVDTTGQIIGEGDTIEQRVVSGASITFMNTQGISYEYSKENVCRPGGGYFVHDCDEVDHETYEITSRLEGKYKDTTRAHIGNSGLVQYIVTGKFEPGSHTRFEEDFQVFLQNIDLTILD